MKERKLLFKLPNGNFYVWNGESTACLVIHETNRIQDAQDFSSYINPELPCDEGDFIWYDVSLKYKVSPNQSKTERIFGVKSRNPRKS